MSLPLEGRVGWGSVAVRRIRAGEWRAWRALRLRALRESPAAFGSTYEREAPLPEREWRERTAALASAPDRVMLVAEGGSRLAGSAGVFVGDDGVPVVFAMWVAPERRGRGIGMALLEAARDAAIGMGKSVLRLLVMEGNAAAISLYEKAGFVDTGRRVKLARDSSVEEIEMELPLV